jgi:shikimate kinase
VLERALGEASELDQPTVIALGGGTLTRAENLGRTRQAGAVLVWLDCPVEELLARCAGMPDRPLFSSEAGLRRLYDERRPLYEQADYRVEAVEDPARVVERILELVCAGGTEA